MCKKKKVDKNCNPIDLPWGHHRPCIPALLACSLPFWPEIPPIIVTSDSGTQGEERFPQKLLWESLSLPMKEGKRKTLGRRTRDRSVSDGAICGGNLEPRVLEGKQTTEMSGSGDGLTTQTKPHAVHCRCLEQLCPSPLWAGACLPPSLQG